MPPRIRTFITVFTLICCIFGGCSQETRDAHHLHHRETGLDLGVASVQLYAKAPVLLKEKVLLLNVWLRRVTRGNSSTSDGSLPEQSEVHGFAWAEDLDALNRNQDGHMLMGVDQNVWQPRLRLETPRGMVIDAQPVSEVVKNPQVRSSLRPFHFTFTLDTKLPGRCFKLYEESFPGYRASFCLPMTSQRLCRRLVPEDAAAAGDDSGAVPALWSLVFPLRSNGINGTHWEYHARLVANRVFNYAVYQIGIGGAGVLVYADRMMRAGLERVHRISGLIAKGRLIMVTWDMPERSPMAYKYDQALVASHALLGLSSCGPRVLLLLADLDEYLYSAFGHGWPSIHACLARADPRATVHRIQRIAAASTRLEPAREAASWVLPARSLARHPIMAYDRLRREAMPPQYGKVLAAPYGRVLGFYVHDGFPMYGTSQLASAECAFLLHIPNYWGPRAEVADAAAGVGVAEVSAATATIAAAGLGGGGKGSFDSLFNLEGPSGGGGAAVGAAGSAAGGAATGAAVGGSVGATTANGGVAVASSPEYTPFKVSATWAVGPSATAALDAGTTMGRAGGSDGGGGGRVRRRGGSWGMGGGDAAGKGGGAVTAGSGGGEAAAAAAAAAALAAANAAVAVLAAAANPAVGSMAQSGGTAGQGSSAAGGAAGEGAGGGTNIAADADRWAALAAEKAKARVAEEANPAGKDAAAAGTGAGAGDQLSAGASLLAKLLANGGSDGAARGGTAAAGGGTADGDPLALIRGARSGAEGTAGGVMGRRIATQDAAAGDKGSGRLR